jgi:hypothetical protein
LSIRLEAKSTVKAGALDWSRKQRMKLIAFIALKGWF